MYAIISDGGRQYTVREGQQLYVDYRDVAKGESIEFANVLAVSDDAGLKLGDPTVAGVKVSAEVLGAQLGKKLVVQKLRRRKNSRRKTGHRQVHTKVRIDKIVGAQSSSPEKAATSEPAAQEPMPQEASPPEPVSAQD